MVARARTSKPQSLKGPSYSPGAADWVTSPSMAGPMHPPCHIPFAHYAVMYIDDMDELNVAVSPSIHQGSGAIFTQDVQQKFVEMARSEHGLQKPTYNSLNYGDEAAGYRRGSTRARPPLETCRPGKRRRRSSSADEVQPRSTKGMKALRIGDSDKIHAFYVAAFKQFHQSNCRHLAKEWIKYIEPKKQNRYPYKGEKETGDSELTKPPWWPAGVMHREPDHIRTEPRLTLLIHILCNLRGSDVSARALKEIADRKMDRTPKSVVLDEIMKVRMLQERYEQGEVDPATIIYVSQDATSKSDRDPDLDDDETKVETEETAGGLAAPTHGLPVNQVPMPAPAASCSFGMGHEQNGFYQTLGSFDSERQPRHAASFCTTFPEYGSNTSAASSVPNTPTTSVMSSPHEQSACDYLAQTQFFPPSSREPIRANQPQAAVPMSSQPGQVDWMPSFRHNVFGTMDYGTSQAIPQPSIHDSIPITAASPMPALGHPQSSCHQDLSRPRMDMADSRGMPFRTGSLGHPNAIPPSHDPSTLVPPSSFYCGPNDNRS